MPSVSATSRGKIDGKAVAMGEITKLMTGPAETRQYLSTGVIEDVHLLVAPVHHVQVLLLSVG